MSSWFVLCITFGSLFIVTGKRYAELNELGDGAQVSRATLGTYSLGYLRMVLAVSCGAAILSYCIWAFENKDLSGTDFPFYELSIVPDAHGPAALCPGARSGARCRTRGGVRERPRPAAARRLLDRDLRRGGVPG
jgi:hypothetical protein